MSKHFTVLKKETIDFLNPHDDGIYVDATFGSGGHSFEIVSRVDSKVIAFEVHEPSIVDFQSKDHTLKSKICLINRNFSEIKNVLRELQINLIDGLVADLGWSLDQLESVQGLSYQKLNDDLDMRLNSNLLVCARDILNAASKDELSEIFARYADFFGKDNSILVQTIRNFRSNRLFLHVRDLVQVCDRAFNLKEIKSKSRRHNIYARVFQALRVKVNEEYENLEKLLVDSLEFLKSGSRVCVISFHSGEEKIVKSFLDRYTRKNQVSVISKSSDGIFLRPSVDELIQNLRSRSAKLFVYEKL
ncbi:16S rRNA (cytosine(1402)-N(4))-methyltransferase [Candidatus Dojkabacteria bacterium]|uniref:16S rRNA (Cytosine(1402)-N(4))-methyltransferase n=1 Tax=Candidatus Dojkabacteria bacterium TaxID=2099670 RepID=A0A3M0YY43_9BACT|nr:MAG: 16S rRNA (cytosine(1402)-N(4))-methyltransferase [Candidatus Dojkabacteria bacterium]